MLQTHAAPSLCGREMHCSHLPGQPASWQAVQDDWGFAGRHCRKLQLLGKTQTGLSDNTPALCRLPLSDNLIW